MKRQASWRGRPRPAKRQPPQPAAQPLLSLSGGLPSVTADQVRYHRLRASYLVGSDLQGPAGLTFLAAAHFGIQAQESTSAYVSLYQRIAAGAAAWDAKDHKHNDAAAAGPSPPSLDQFRDWFMSNTGLIRIWGQRATLQIYDSADWPYVCAAVGAGVIQNRITSVCSGNVTGRDSTPELSAARETVSALLAQGKLVAATDFVKLGFSPKLVYSVFMCCTVEGLGARHDHGAGTVSLLAPRSVVAPEEEYPWRTVSTLDALAEAARRYFKTYGPAMEEDFRYYMGVSARPSKEAVALLLATGEISTVIVSPPSSDAPAVETPTTGKAKKAKAGGAYYVASSSLPLLLQPVPDVAQWPPRLLYRFDPLLLAHVDKSFWIPAEHKSTTWTKNGIILPTVLIGGRVTGTWTLVQQKKSSSSSSSEQTVMSFTVIALPGFPLYEGEVAQALERQARGIAGFLGGVFGGITFD
ncbi:winged helix DNA-binding domain-containing protein [Geranomyces variabilis]|nr:winged helix DNA-binding domain-containing protein [Geranomyces variabilis]KAJ3140970.1 hypothetical protein HDU90_006991 [Geranomyces variabilis]